MALSDLLTNMFTSSEMTDEQKKQKELADQQAAQAAQQASQQASQQAQQTTQQNQQGQQPMPTGGNPIAPTAPIQQPQQQPQPQQAQPQTTTAQAQPQTTNAVPQQQPQQQPNPGNPSSPTNSQLNNQPLQPVNPQQVMDQTPPMPQPGPGVQLAGPMVPGAVQQPQEQNQQPANQGQQPANQGQQPAVINSPQWSQDLQNANGDITKLHAVAGNPNYPEEARNLAGEMIKKTYDHQVGSQNANNTINQAFSGQDPKAMNTVMSELRKERGEGSYIKAYMFHRLGLNQLAQEEQQKLGAGNKIGQTILDGSHYTVDRDANGGIIRAWNSEGQRADDKTLAKLSAAGAPSGTHAFGFTGEPGIVTEANGTKAEVRQRTNAITGSIENVYTSGPNAGKLYTGTQIPQAKSVSTAAAKSDYQLINDLQKKHGGNVLDALKDFESERGPMTPEARKQFITNYGYGTTVPNGTMPGAGAQPIGAPAQAQPAGAPAQPQTAGARPGMQNAAPMNQNIPVSQPAVGQVGTTGGGGGINTPTAALKQSRLLGTKQGEEDINITGKRSEGFNKYVDETVTPEGQKGEIVRNNRKAQFGLLKQLDENNKPIDEQLSGLYNAANEHPGEQKWSIVRDVLAGKALPENDASNRIAQLDITPKAKAMLQQYNALNAQISSQTLRETSGPGSVSDAEQAANRARNVDITKTPMLGVYQMMGQSQFNGDLARYKADHAAETTAPNTAKFEKDFRKESTALTDAYRQISEARLAYIQKNGNTPQAIRNGYVMYPVPEYNPATGKWEKLKPAGEVVR